MSTSTSMKVTPNVVLDLINLHNVDEFDEIHRQRVLCGWDLEIRTIERWRDEMDARNRALFWIHAFPIIPTALTRIAKQPSLESQRIGHIGFQNVPEDDESLAEVAGLGKSILMISAFFILEEHRAQGFGRMAVEILEAMTQLEPYGSPDCQALILTALSRKYVNDEGDGSPDDWKYSRKLWARCGIPLPPKGRSVEDWYSRMGYIKWKEENTSTWPIKLLDGTEFGILHAFMRKQLH